MMRKTRGDAIQMSAFVPTGAVTYHFLSFFLTCNAMLMSAVLQVAENMQRIATLSQELFPHVRSTQVFFAKHANSLEGMHMLRERYVTSCRISRRKVPCNIS